jgi:hypothetical protein
MFFYANFGSRFILPHHQVENVCATTAAAQHHHSSSTTKK